MDMNVGVLPRDVLDTLLMKLDGDVEASSLRFLRLPHPRTGIPSLFLPYKSSSRQTTTILEVQAIVPPNERSWIMSEGTIIGDGKLLLMTPVDPAFLLIPILRSIYLVDGSYGTFRPADDILEDAMKTYFASLGGTCAIKGDPSSQLSQSDLANLCSLDCVHTAMKRICEVKEITPEIIVFRYSPECVLEYLRGKVTKLWKPAILESSRTVVRGLAKDGLMEEGNEALLNSGHLKAACDLVSQYIPQDLHDELQAFYDFAALNAHLDANQKELSALAASKMSNIEARESGKAVKADGKKRKGPTKGSHGVEKLKKVNTKGMAKLSSFFQKTA
ncbi:unnamed protein product [Somion occarium]|uniref:Ribonuclease H2 subunit B n=1 Tax=Somion occarium TaxID=3059160 RepID=A0ABP1DLP7_9APHY